MRRKHDLRPLLLNTTTIRSLDTRALRDVAGGDSGAITCMFTCTSDGCTHGGGGAKQ